MRKEVTGKNRLREAVLLTFVLSGAAAAAYAGKTNPLIDGRLFATRPTALAAELASWQALFDFTPAASAVARPPASRATAFSDAALYRQIFTLQDRGDWTAADAAMSRLTDDSLRGHVLARRYLANPAYHASFAELADWLRLYADLPGADAIYKLAMSRAPDGVAATLPAPARPDGITGYLDLFADRSDAYVTTKVRTPAEDAAIDALTRQIRDAVGHGLGSKAENLLSYTAAAKHLDPVEYDQLRAQVASAFYYEGKIGTALNLSEASLARSGSNAPLAGWIGGLAAWRQVRYVRSASLFEFAATSPYASSWTAAAASYWAYRAHIRAGEAAAAAPWLERAAGYPRTFYGLIALKVLHRAVGFHWDMPALTPVLLAKLETLPAGRRAVALVAAGQPHLAERELLQINPGADPELTEAMLAYADHAGLPALAMRLAEAVPHPGGGLYDAALYPLSPWTPSNGYTVDRALIHAIVRQESRFNPAALSQSGAMGLMQLMPGTASDVTKQHAATAGGPGLADPENNLELGQRYVINLIGQEPDSTELFSIIASYNAGPGNVRHWKDALDNSADPLLFLESLPVAQTRAFTERVMTNYWIYALRLKQPVPSLDSVASGKWARYVASDEVQHASLEPADLKRATIH